MDMEGEGLRSLELQLRQEGEGLALGTAPLCLHSSLRGTSYSSLEPVQSPDLLLKMEAKLFLGGGRGKGGI